MRPSETHEYEPNYSRAKKHAEIVHKDAQLRQAKRQDLTPTRNHIPLGNMLFPVSVVPDQSGFATEKLLTILTEPHKVGVQSSDTPGSHTTEQFEPLFPGYKDFYVRVDVISSWIDDPMVEISGATLAELRGYDSKDVRFVSLYAVPPLQGRGQT